MADHQEISSALFNREIASQEDREEFRELYKLMVQTSESLVARRQGVNTFFLTMNGLLITAIGLFLKGGGHRNLQAGGILVLAVLGVVLCFSWRSLLISFGQLNTGKFKIINAMEQKLVASIFSGEWEALDHGSNPKVYRSFTKREVTIPLSFGAIYVLVVILSGLVSVGWWKP